MKKLIIGLLSIMVLTVSADAQDAKKAIKNAEKALKEFMKNPSANGETAKAALATMESEFGSPEKGEHYIKKADLYMDVAESEEKIKLLNPAYELAIPDASVKAYEAYKSALAIGDKDKDALKGIENVMGSLNNLGIAYFEQKAYEASFKHYDMVTEAHNTLLANDKESMLTDPAIFTQHKFYTAVAGYYGGMSADILPYLEPLYEEKYDHAFVYEALFSILKENDSERALKVLQEGRERYPEEKGLLYAEINYYLSIGELEAPISRIKIAIEQDPSNISLYTTLGNVYDQLTNQTREGGDMEKAQEYFNEAFSHFSKAIELSPDNFDAQYSLGALYYNKAAFMTTEINELANDYSAEGTKKYNERKTEMDGYFDEALPFFEKAHTLDASDQNTMIALREIYARKNMFEKVNEMKEKLESLGG